MQVRLQVILRGGDEDMSERRNCQWMRKHRKIGIGKDEPCTICRGYVVLKGKSTCPFESITSELIQELQHLVTADERLYSIQAGVRRQKRTKTC